MASQTDNWNDTTGDWATATDWSLGATPGSLFDTDAVISGGGTAFTVTVDSPQQAADVTLEGAGATLSVALGEALLLGDANTPAPVFTLSSGATLSLAGTLAAASGVGPFTLNEDGGSQVYNGGTLSDVVIVGPLDLTSAVTATSGTSGSTAQVLSVINGMTLSGAMLLGSSTLQVLGGQAVFSGTTISNISGTGTIDLAAGATLTMVGSDGTTAPIAAGGILDITGGGTLAIASGAVLDLDGNTVNVATALQNSGQLTVTSYSPVVTLSGPVTGTGTIVMDGEPFGTAHLEIGGTVAATQTIDMSNGGNQLILDNVDAATPTSFVAPISGLHTISNGIALPQVAFNAAALSGTVTNGMLTVTSGGTLVAQLNTPDLAAGQAVGFAAYGPSGTEVIACYCAGTAIRTARGEVPVETLLAGDTVRTFDGADRPIRWIGVRSYAGRFLRGRPELQPVRLTAGSLGGGLPHRDLLVSPNHAMFIDGALIPAAALVNGLTIRREPGLATVQYFHLELETHDVIFADGAPSETFIDDDSRGVFHNAASYDGPVRPAVYYAPRMESGALVERVRQRCSWAA